jgi:hypothetical protein
MYVNGKMTSVETIPGMGGRKGLRKMVEEVNSNMTYCKNICKCHNMPPSSTTIKKREKKGRYYIWCCS